MPTLFPGRCNPPKTMKPVYTLKKGAANADSPLRTFGGGTMSPTRRAEGSAGGAAGVEAVLVLPLLVLLFFGVADVYFYTNTYLAFVQIGREAVLTGVFSSGADSVADDLDPSLADYNACEPDPSGDCMHTVIHWRVRRLVESHSPRIVEGTLGIRSSGSAATKEVTALVSGTYRSLFPLFSGVPVRAEVKATSLGV